MPPFPHAISISTIGNFRAKKIFCKHGEKSCELQKKIVPLHLKKEIDSDFGVLLEYILNNTMVL